MRLAKRAPLFVLATALLVPLAACGGEDAADGGGGGGGGGGGEDECYTNPASCVDMTGSDSQFVANAVEMPSNPTTANALGLNLDNDPKGRADNALGLILSTLAMQGGFDLQEALDQQLQEGNIIIMMNLRAANLTTATDAGMWVFLGDNPNPVACADETDMVCGGHLDGDATFDIAADSPTDAILAGQLVGGEFTGGPGRVTLQIALGGDSMPITLRLIGARMEASVTATGITEGKIGGALTEAELDSNVLPAIVGVIGDTVAMNCAGGTPPSCCEQGSTGDTLIGLFDDCSEGSTTCDCQVTLEELRNNDLISSLLASDVDLLDATGAFKPRTDNVPDSLSLGIGFTAATAMFPAP